MWPVRNTKYKQMQHAIQYIVSTNPQAGTFTSLTQCAPNTEHYHGLDCARVSLILCV